jgi:hypothetical protein
MKEHLWLQQAEERLRRAAERGDFATAQKAALDYTLAVERTVPGLPRTAAASRIRQAMAAMESARRQLCVARARLSRKLQAVDCRIRFQQTSIATNTWRIEA